MFLTPNATVVYAWFCVDLSDGLIVVDVPPGVRKAIDDAYFRFVTDLGSTGPDGGQGGGTCGARATLTRCRVKATSSTPRTYINLFIVAPSSGRRCGHHGKGIKNSARVYALSAAADPRDDLRQHIEGPVQISANDFHFYEELNDVVQQAVRLR